MSRILRIFNPDGSEAELSGNGAREAVLYLRRRGWTDADSFSIRTLAGAISPTITGPNTCRMDMGAASLHSPAFPSGGADGLGEVCAGGRSWSFQHVSIGNPQCAIHVADAGELERLDLPAIGPSIESDEQFPRRTNVSWYAELEQGRIRARIFERGVGETLASGTGASGAAVAHVCRLARERGTARAGTVTVVLDGGELEVEVGEELRVDLTGWAKPVFEGRLSDEFAEELNETE